MSKCIKCMYLENGWCHLYNQPQIKIMKYCVDSVYFQNETNKNIILEINTLHKEIDEILDKKLETIDWCLKNLKKCPCSQKKCEVPTEKLERIELLYKKISKVINFKSLIN